MCVLSSLLILVPLSLQMLHSSGIMQKNTFSIVFPELPTAPMRGKKEEEAFQVAIIRWYYVYDPWRNIKEVGRRGDTNTDS